MSNVPTVSVIVPVYNTPPELLTACLDSLLAQSLGETEIIVVDDCSTDGSRGVIDSFAQDDRITVLYQARNMGLASTRNLGIDHSRGDFVGFVDSDDFIDPSMFERMSEVAIANGADVFACAMINHGLDGSATVTQHPLPSGMALSGRELHAFLRTAHTAKAYWYAQRFLFRRTFLQDRGLRFDPEIRLGEDTVVKDHWFLTGGGHET